MTQGGNYIAHGGQRIAIFFWDGYLGVAPSMINAIHLLAKAGYLVDIITRSNDGGWAPPPIFNWNVRIHICPPTEGTSEIPATAGVRSIRRSMLGKIWHRSKDRFFVVAKRLSRGAVKKKTIPQIRCRWNYVRFGRACTVGKDYACFIGVDMDGLVAAVAARRKRRIPLLYWSLEIRFLHELRDISDRLMKRLERRCGRAIDLIIVQDKQRAESLLSSNGWGGGQIALIPNGPLGEAPSLSSNYFHQKFSLPPRIRLALHTGMISPAVLSLQLAEAASRWPESWRLVLHERASRDPSDAYLKAVAGAGGGRVLMSLEPVPYDQLDTIISSGYIGIALYDVSLGPNYGLMAGASGKAAHYLRCGLPVICVALPGLGEVLRRYHCGIAVDRIEDVYPALEHVESNYAVYRKNAVRCYEEVYEFGRHFQGVLSVIRSLSAAPEQED